MKYEVIIGEEIFTVEVDGEDSVLLNGERVTIDFGSMGVSGLYSLLVNNESFEALVEQNDEVWQVLMRGNLYDVQVIDERSQLLRSRETSLVPDSGEVAIKAPMPGLVVAVPVEVGQEVEKGDNVIILESMKMENELKAPRAGRIDRVMVEAGDNVDQHQTMVVIV